MVADQPIAVTFCPLCNTGIVFDARVNGRALEFGVSGLLRRSDMIMYDRQTESWWQQAVREAVVGHCARTSLTPLLARLDSWSSFRAERPDGLVMNQSRTSRGCGSNPYEGYDSGWPFLYDAAPPPFGIDPMERMVRVGNRVWPLTRLRAAGRIGRAGLVLHWESGQASALDTGRIGERREVGNVRVRDAAGRDVVFAMPFAFAFHAFHPDGIWMRGN